jgi:hypothetical protein
VKHAVQRGILGTNSAFAPGSRKTTENLDRLGYPVPLCPPHTPNAARTRKRASRGGKPATNTLSYGTASACIYSLLFCFVLFFCEKRAQTSLLCL